MSMQSHPDVQQYRQTPRRPKARIDPELLRRWALDAGADDVGFVSIDDPALDDQREDILRVFPAARTLVPYVVRMNRTPIRSPARSVANLEFHHVGDAVNEVGRELVQRIEAQGYQGLNPAMGFPMEAQQWPGKMWVVSHKPVAVAAGLGVMGIHRNVIHPRFGNFILLGTVLTDVELEHHDQPLEYNPCLSCKLCVAACPVGAIGADGHFDFNSCYTHNYREFMGGFADWVDEIADADDRVALHGRIDDHEMVSQWQSLSFGPNYKAAYCMSVCPAGSDVIGPFIDDRKGFLRDVVKPLQEKEEDVYVLERSDAAAHVQKRYPHKRLRVVHNGIRARSIASFVRGMPLLFQRHQAADLDATYHFSFFGDETRDVTVRIADRKLTIDEGLVGAADVTVAADSATWLRYLAREGGIVWPVVRRKVRVKGPLALLQRFAACFPT